MFGNDGSRLFLRQRRYIRILPLGWEFLIIKSNTASPRWSQQGKLRTSLEASLVTRWDQMLSGDSEPTAPSTLQIPWF